ncbi:hypothetical protein GCM10025864_25690 [Luteimicrobium album]|uniref:DUF2182 domain-containing protein n=1 Tax=Luteimicrobium album TaxID=1054550 RepID=A0ABQ6I4V1_9MICO|nr:DUF2182 domain-containing protein [Luteimicrobium album]GMA24810.1 hypothetical protein GCM10025864_25690 [Luteimicrobium album]
MPRLRLRRVVLLLAGYGAVWTVGLLALDRAAATVHAAPWWVLVAVLVGTCTWQCAPGRHRCVKRMHGGRPLPVFGLRADVGTVAAGLRHGVWCAGSCWALMLVAMLANGLAGLGLMALVASWLWVEHLDPPRRPGWGPHIPWRAARILLTAVRRHRPKYTAPVARH